MMLDDDILAVLQSIDGSLKALLALQRQAAPAGGHTIASDRDLDSRYGNPAVKFDPRDWTGPSCKGRAMSECPPDFLDLIAETFDYFAKKADENDERTDRGKAVADFKRTDAARARGWAKRIRDGKHIQNSPVAQDEEPPAPEWESPSW